MNDNILSFTILLYINTYHNKVFILFMMYVKNVRLYRNIIVIKNVIQFIGWFQSRDLDISNSNMARKILNQYTVDSDRSNMYQIILFM